MWLLIDIGNTNTKFASVDLADQKIHRLGSVPSSGKKLQGALVRLVDEHRFERVGFCSVVPSLSAAVLDLFQFADVPALEVSPFINLPFTIDYNTPATLGTDRIAAVAGAWSLFGDAGLNVLTIDAGSAVTYDLLTRDNRFAGGSIGAGPSAILKGLTASTEQLVEVDYHVAAEPIARSTEEAIRAGIRFGFLDMVSGMIERCSSAIDGRPLVLVTGGWGQWLKERIATIDHFEPDVVFCGIRTLMERNPISHVFQHPAMGQLSSD